MRDLHRWFSGRGLAAGAAVILLLGAGMLLLVEGSEDRPPANSAGVEISTSQPQAPLGEQVSELTKAMTPAPVALDLPQIVDAADAAAGAYAAGIASVPQNVALAGGRFELHVPFGCGGRDTDGEGALSWSYDRDRKALTLKAKPQVWDTSLFGGGSSEESRAEAIEGFWIPRPWLTAETCPARSAPPQPSPPLPPQRQTLGLAQFFRSETSRLPRRSGDAYEIVKRVPAEAIDSAIGFRLILRGRIVALPDAQTIRCHSESVDHRPICVVSVEFDYIAFENPKNGDIIAEWRT